MSARLRDREVERIIEEELAQHKALVVDYRHKGSGNRELRFTAHGKVGRFVFPRNPPSCSRSVKNMVHILRRLIKGMEA
jgi:hypothetical protein